MPESIHPLPRRKAQRAQPAGQVWSRGLGLAAAGLTFAALVGALRSVVGDFAIAAMLAGVAGITAAPFFGGRSKGGRMS
jgi:hypothetical protein